MTDLISHRGNALFVQNFNRRQGLCYNFRATEATSLLQVQIFKQVCKVKRKSSTFSFTQNSYTLNIDLIILATPRCNNLISDGAQDWFIYNIIMDTGNTFKNIYLF